jgi:hypothetical protein
MNIDIKFLSNLIYDYNKKYIFESPNSFLLIRKLYFHWKSIYTDIDFPLQMFCKYVFKSNPVYISSCCKWGWCNYKLIKKNDNMDYVSLYEWFLNNSLKKEKCLNNKIENQNSNNILNNSLNYNKYVEIKELWNLFKSIIPDKKYHNKCQFYNTIYIKYNKYCLFEPKNIIKKYSDNLNNLEDNIKYFLDNNLIITNNNNNILNFRDIWDEFKKSYLLKTSNLELILLYKYRIIFTNILEKYLSNNKINYIKINNRISLIKNIKFKYVITNHISTLVYIINYSIDVGDLHFTSLNNIDYNTINLCQKFKNYPQYNNITTYSKSYIQKIEKNPSIINNYFNHKELYDYAYKELLNQICPKLFDFYELNYIDYRDYRPIFFKRNSEYMRNYGEMSERIIYKILLNIGIKKSISFDIKIENSDITNIINDIFNFSLPENSINELKQLYLDIINILKKIIEDKKSISFSKRENIQSDESNKNENNYIKRLEIQCELIYKHYIIRPDLIINDIIFDIKEIQSIHCVDQLISFQLWIYYCILNKLGYCISKIGIIAPNKSAIIIYNLDNLSIKPDEMLKNISQMIFKNTSQYYGVPLINNKLEQEEIILKLLEQSNFNLIKKEIKCELYMYNNNIIEHINNI